MPIQTEIQDLSQENLILENSKENRYLLGNIMSRGGFAGWVQYYTSNNTLDYRVLLALCETSGGAFTLTLPRGNAHSIQSPQRQKTPLYIIYHYGGANALTIAPGGAADTINGAATINLALGNFILVFNDGISAWYARAI